MFNDAVRKLIAKQRFSAQCLAAQRNRPTGSWKMPNARLAPALDTSARQLMSDVLEEKQSIARSDRDRSFHDQTAPWYDEAVVEPRAIANDYLFREAVSRLPAFANLRMLDLGCGTGHMTNRLLPYMGSVDMVDHSYGMLRAARSMLGEYKRTNSGATVADVQIHHVDLLDYLQFAAASGRTYDVITTIGVMHHLTARERTAAAATIRGILALGGIWLIAEPTVTPHSEPPLLTWWNRPYRQAFNLPWGHVAVKDPDEGPLTGDDVADLKQNYAVLHERQGWEIFPRFGGSFVDKAAIGILDHVRRKQGFIWCAALGHQARQRVTATHASGAI